MVGTIGRVLTEGGVFTQYQNCKKTQSGALVVKVVFNDGRSVICTPDHKFLTINHEWKEAKDLIGLSVYDTISHLINEGGICKSRLSATRLSALMARIIGFADSIFSAMVKGSIVPYGNITMAKSRMDFTSITKTGIGQITISKILNCLKVRHTKRCMEKKAIGLNGLAPCIEGLKSGTVARRENNSIKSNMRNIAEKQSQKESILSARNAENITRESEGSSVQTTANRHGAESTISTSSLLSAQYAEKQKWFRNILTARLVRAYVAQYSNDPVVVAIIDAGLADTYCLDADITHSFAVSGGIIVHNCFDETRYRVTAPKIGTVSSGRLLGV